MKLEDLLEFSADKLKALSNEQLEALCKPFWDVTRPPIGEPKKSAVEKSLEKTGMSQEKLNILRSLGIK